jgi:phage gpG-like protein
MSALADAETASRSALIKWGAAQEVRIKQSYPRRGHLFHGGIQHRPLATSTIARNGGRTVPLLDTGQMMRGTFTRFAGKMLMISNGDWKAKFHQYGTKTIPARPMNVVTNEDIGELKAILKQKLEVTLVAI